MQISVVPWQNEAAVFRQCANSALLDPSALCESTRSIARIASAYEIQVSEEPSDSGFRLDQENQTIVFFVAGLDMMYKQAAQVFPEISVEDIQKICVTLYFAHEIYHVAQNISDFKDVQLLKEASSNELGKLDLIADVAAANFIADVRGSLFDDNQVSRVAFFLFAVEFIIRVAFPAFGVPFEKTHKVKRALGLMFVRHRTAKELTLADSSMNYSLALYPEISPDFAKWVIFQYGGDLSVKIVDVFQVSPEKAIELAKILETGDLDKISASFNRIFA